MSSFLFPVFCLSFAFSASSTEAPSLLPAFRSDELRRNFGGGTEKGERGVRPRWEVCKRSLGEIDNLFGLRIAKIIGLPFRKVL